MPRKLPLLIAALIAAGAPGWTPWGGPLRALAVAEPQFTAASLKGTCGFNAATTNVNPHSPGFLHPTSSYGTLAFDGVSSVTGELTVNNSGKLIPAKSLTGSYAVLADGGPASWTSPARAAQSTPSSSPAAAPKSATSTLARSIPPPE